MITVWNPTDRIISEHVNGQLITVPARGSTLVTERKAPELLRLQPQLRAAQTAAYAEADFAGLKGLTRERLEEFAALLMRGVQPKLAEFEEKRKAESGKPK